MRGTIAVLLTVAYLLLFLTVGVCQAVPARISYQGVIEDIDGPVTDSLAMTFRLYDTEAGTTLLWEEEQSVVVDQGIYNVILGTGTLNPSYGTLEEAILTSDALWLEVYIEGDVDAMSPRQPITSVGFAMRAGTVSDGAITAVKLASDAVTTEKLVDGAVTADKVSGGFVPNLDADRLDGHSAEEFGTAAELAQAQEEIATLRKEMDVILNLLANISRSGDNIYITGANLHIRSGSGSTSGTINGRGNLIVGYDEARSSGSEKTGSHNIVVGRNHNYSSYGGLVAGYQNTISADYANVTGGYYHIASGAYASVSGGQSNTAAGNAASISGGFGHTASGSRSSVSGGYGHTASGYAASASGGRYNMVSGQYASISGGQNNIASGGFASISGGRSNTASGDYAFVGGGGGAGDHDGNIAFADYSAILGGLNNLTGDGERDGLSGQFELTGGTDHGIGIRATVSGGHRNWAEGEDACVSGGRINEATGQSASVSGGIYNFAQGYWSSVSGGENNGATGIAASAGGGGSNRAAGSNSSISGGYFSTADGSYASISGGYWNTADGDYSSVSGGYKNTAGGNQSSISGGNTRSVSGAYDWRAGALFEDQ